MSASSALHRTLETQPKFAGSWARHSLSTAIIAGPASAFFPSDSSTRVAFPMLRSPDLILVPLDNISEVTSPC